MPTVAIVDGVKIQFYAREHPHAIFAEHRAQIDLATLRVLNGSLPPAKLAVVLAWAMPRREALQSAWNTVQGQQRPEKIR